MTLSAEFSVNGDSDVQEHLVSYGGSVALVALSTSFRTIAWEISSGSKSGATAPTISLAGTPSGSTASFTQVADPSDGLGRSWVVKCTQTDAAGNQAVAYRVVGTVNDNGLLPICADEENYRDSTHGWSQVVNTVLAQASGVGSSSGASGRGFLFTYSTTTTDADPGAGTFRGNNATLASVTQLFVDLTEYGGTDVTAWLDSLDDAPGTIKGVIRLESRLNSAHWIEYNLTGWTTATGYRKLTVAYVAGPGGLVTTAGDTFLSFDANPNGGNIRADGSVAFSANQSLGTNRLTSVGDPSGAQDAATKNYVDRVSTDDSSTSRNFAATDQTKYLRNTSASATSLTVLPQSSVATTEACYMGIQAGAGQVTFVQGSGVTINTPETLKCRKQYSSWCLRQKGSSDVWDLSGDLELA